MPAKSEAQRKFMGQVLSYKRGKLKNPSKKVREAAESMSESEARDFAKSQKKAAAIVRRHLTSI